jgi:hypothetical protein
VLRSLLAIVDLLDPYGMTAASSGVYQALAGSYRARTPLGVGAIMTTAVDYFTRIAHHMRGTTT